uniref:Uncharacterized protein n=1 Tax=Anopheles coluzzii TaxID=1518534 RepID=A0A8W7PS95_ANOCL
MCRKRIVKTSSPSCTPRIGESWQELPFQSCYANGRVAAMVVHRRRRLVSFTGLRYYREIVAVSGNRIFTFFSKTMYNLFSSSKHFFIPATISYERFNCVSMCAVSIRTIEDSCDGRWIYKFVQKIVIQTE